uniref:Uncharacterized protein n=1 Tax=Anguilla anguilla TaxID=7936 RepID=A0A0E9WRE6_ANGAN
MTDSHSGGKNLSKNLKTLTVFNIPSHGMSADIQLSHTRIVQMVRNAGLIKRACFRKIFHWNILFLKIKKRFDQTSPDSENVGNPAPQSPVHALLRSGRNFLFSVSCFLYRGV